MQISADITKGEVADYRKDRRRDTISKLSDMTAAVAALSASFTLLYFDALASNSFNHGQLVSELVEWTKTFQFSWNDKIIARVILLIATVFGVFRAFALAFNTFFYQRRIDKIEIEVGKVTESIDKFAENAGPKKLKIIEENKKKIQNNFFASTHAAYVQYLFTILGTLMLLRSLGRGLVS